MNKSTVRLIAIFILSISYSSCTDVEKGIDTLQPAVRQITFNLQKKQDITLTNINGYLFRKGTFYKAFKDIQPNGEGKINMNVPANSQLFFLANIPEPAQLTSMKEGVTTLNDFLSYHTPDDEVHSQTKAPSQFYNAQVSPDLSTSEFNITMGLSVARIDLDASEASAVKIERIYTEEATATTNYFIGGTPSPTQKNCRYSHEFKIPETDKVEDIFRIYEKNSPIVFILEGTHGNTPISIEVPIKRIERNKIYKIRIQAAGMDITSNVNVADWTTGEEILADEEISGSIKLDPDESYFPEGVEMVSNSEVTVPWNGAKDLQLAFTSSEPLYLHSTEGQISISSPHISSKDGLILTKFNLELPVNETKLTTCVTLNLQSSIEGKMMNSKITLNTLPYSYDIPEVTIGKKTWMAFNSTSQKISEQIFPQKYGITDIKSMYDNMWVNTLGNMFQYGRLYPYLPWYDGTIEQQEELPWTNAVNTPCPPGYRLPTQKELRDLITGDGSHGGGHIPSIWHYNGDVITSNIIEKNNVSTNGIQGKARYLELKNQDGVAIYLPLGGMKDYNNPVSKDPGLGIGVRYWTSESLGSDKAYACELIYQNDGEHTTPYTGLELNKEVFSYVRCIKSLY